jgi:hypothetical protein
VGDVVNIEGVSSNYNTVARVATISTSGGVMKVFTYQTASLTDIAAVTGTGQVTGSDTFCLAVNRPYAEDDAIRFPVYRWQGMPGGCALYGDLLATPGVYMSDLYGASNTGCVLRLDGENLDTCTATDQAIPWAWSTGVLLAAPADVNQPTREVSVVTGLRDPITSLTARLFLNGSSTVHAEKALTITARPTGTGSARWQPARAAAAYGTRVELLGASTAGAEILALTHEVVPRGRAL